MAKEVKFYKPTINAIQKKLVTEVLEGSEPDAMRYDLEDAMCELTGASFAVATCNATAAMHLTLCAMELKRGDKVLCSVNCFPAVPEVVRHFDAEPVFIDIKEGEFNIDLDALEIYLEANNSKKLKAVIITHIAGQPTDLERVYNIAKIYDIKVIEDATEAMGVEYQGAPIGSTGADATIFAFSPHAKREASCGGVLVCENEELYERANLLANHAITTPEEDSLNYIYDIVDIGYKYTISELDAAYSLGYLDNVKNSIARHKEIAGIYFDKLNGVNHIELPEESDSHPYSLFIIKVDKNRDSFARDLNAEGIETSLHFIPLHLLSYYKSKYLLKINNYPKPIKIIIQVK